MKIVGIYSFKNGKNVVESKYPHLLAEITKIVNGVNLEQHKTKTSKEKTMSGRALYNPKSLNAAFKDKFFKLSWKNKRVKCDYPTQYYTKGYTPGVLHKGAFRDMDFLKERLGVEVQFGKYAFMVYNVCAKMTIFSRLGFIDAGVEIVPIKEVAEQMSTGVSYFEQFIWDLEKRGIADIDIPVLIPATINGMEAGRITLSHFLDTEVVSKEDALE